MRLLLTLENRNTLDIDLGGDFAYALRGMHVQPLASNIINAAESLPFMQGTAIDLFPRVTVAPQNDTGETQQIPTITPTTYVVLQTREEIEEAQTNGQGDLRASETLRERFNAYKAEVLANLEVERQALLEKLSSCDEEVKIRWEERVADNQRTTGWRAKLEIPFPGQ